jgi:prepilin-type N-terminal cleavage/methylation domain-containing protein
MKKKNGFTLVELIVTLVILIVLTLIATNIILSRINKTRQEAFLDKVKIYIKGLDADVMDNKEYDEFKVYNFPGYKIKAVDEQPDAGFIMKNEDNEYRAQIWNNKLEKCAVKGFSDTDVKISKTIKNKADCVSSYASANNVIGQSIYNLFGIEMKDSDGNDVVIKESCYTVNSSGQITDYDADKCGYIFITPDKIDGKDITGFNTDFYNNLRNKDVTDFYIANVPKLTTIPSGFLSGNSNVKNIMIYGNPLLTEIPAGFLSGDRNLDSVRIINNPNLTTFAQGNFFFSQTDHGFIKKIEFADLPKLSTFSAVFAYVDFEEFILRNIGEDSGDGIQIKDNALTNNIGVNNARLIIEDNKGLYYGSDGAMSSFYSTDHDKSSISYVSIKNNKRLDLLSYSFLCNVKYNNAEIYIENNDSLTGIRNSAFIGDGTIKKLIIKNNKNLTGFGESALSGNTSNGGLQFVNGDLIIENNDSLAEITNSAMGGLAGTINKFSISNNKNLLTFTNGALTNNSNNKPNIKEFIVKNNAKLSIIENGTISNYKIDKAVFENNASLDNLCRYSAFSNNEINVLDLSKSQFTTVETSCGIYNNSINTLILPTTLTNFTPGHLTSGVKKEVYAGGPNKCALNNYFINYNPDGSIAGYNVNPSIVPVCD